MVVRKKKQPRKKKAKRFHFQLSSTGIVGIAMVSFCLFFWMFLLGIWAGQTILLPSAESQASQNMAVQVGKQYKGAMPAITAQKKKKTMGSVER